MKKYTGPMPKPRPAMASPALPMNREMTRGMKVERGATKNKKYGLCSTGGTFTGAYASDK